MQFRNFNRKTAFIRRKRVQVIEETINPFQERKNISSLSVTAASGAKGIAFSIDDLESTDVNRIRKWLLNGEMDYASTD